jgi:NTP pyrophosphatase (non-canonical NTP hydrolase)
MDLQKQNEILSKAIETYGINNQLDMAIEECAELIQAINKVKRTKKHIYRQEIFNDPNKPEDTLTYFNVCSEIADVKIMIRQLELLFNKEAIDTSFDRKLKRLDKRMNQ